MMKSNHQNHGIDDDTGMLCKHVTQVEPLM
jgi:hypothetical protein